MADGFTFYRSFLAAIRRLPEDRRLEAYEAVAGYAMEGREPEGDPFPPGVFELVRSIIDSDKEGGNKDG